MGPILLGLRGSVSLGLTRARGDVGVIEAICVDGGVVSLIVRDDDDVAVDIGRLDVAGRCGATDDGVKGGVSGESTLIGVGGRVQVALDAGLAIASLFTAARAEEERLRRGGTCGRLAPTVVEVDADSSGIGGNESGDEAAVLVVPAVVARLGRRLDTLRPPILFVGLELRLPALLLL